MDTPLAPLPATDDLTALLGSRICHDLISPLGAIGNGVELLSLSGAAAGPEIALITQSVLNANARIRFFRLAFGAAGEGHEVSAAEIQSILGVLNQGGRLAVDWQAPPPHRRADVRMAFLAILCLECALPYGGRITVAGDGDRWTLTAASDRIRTDPQLWQRLDGPPADRTPALPLSPAHVQFALLAQAAAARGRALWLDHGDKAVTLGFQG